ncbi:YciI family protein [Corallococcus exiguus]|uniref:YciI family protein n=1 Tax=Corallococcus exiguus TaxID=83462 RepID=UPI001A90548D|nr:YciI family protein [Corallococcus exiguus]MBN8466973.1 YciI family protein [Corallococcus exiguus]
MRVMVFAIASESTEQGEPPTPEAFEAMERFTEELVKAGILVAGAGLKPSNQSKQILCEGSKRTVIDGPFTEARELIAGFSIWKVKDMDEAVAWAKRSPNVMPGKSKMEIRPFFEAEDMADALGLDAEAREKLGVA